MSVAMQSADQLRRALRMAGLSRNAVDAAWPRWWVAEAEASPSAQAELRFALARNLGLSPKALLGERVEFIWRDRARFKNLSGESDHEKAALDSFGTSIGQLAIRATAGDNLRVVESAEALRKAILARNDVVGLRELIAACWSMGTPVIFLRVFPLTAKSMHAMVVAWGGRHAVLLARAASYPAPVAFTLAHEIGHIVLKHVGDAASLVDLDDPGSAAAATKDGDEVAADRFALTLLTGSPDPDIQVSRAAFGGRQLAEVVLREGPPRGIEPGTLALCTGHATGNWQAAMSALKYVYGGAHLVAPVVNAYASSAFDWSALDHGSADYLQAIMGVG